MMAYHHATSASTSERGRREVTYHGNATKRPLACGITEHAPQALSAAFHGEPRDQGGGVLVVFQNVGCVGDGFRYVGRHLCGCGGNEVVGTGGIGNDALAKAVDGLGEGDDGANPCEHPRSGKDEVFERWSVTRPCGGEVGPGARVAECERRGWCGDCTGRCHLGAVVFALVFPCITAAATQADEPGPLGSRCPTQRWEWRRGGKWTGWRRSQIGWWCMFIMEGPTMVGTLVSGSEPGKIGRSSAGIRRLPRRRASMDGSSRQCQV